MGQLLICLGLRDTYLKTFSEHLKQQPVTGDDNDQYVSAEFNIIHTQVQPVTYTLFGLWLMSNISPIASENSRLFFFLF